MADLLENWHLPLTDFMQRVQTYYGQATRQRLDVGSVVTRQTLRVAERHLYGSSRLGIYKTQDTLRTVDLSLVYKLSDVNLAPTQTLTKKEFYSFDSTYTHKRGDKLYEGSNHLGNVLVTFSDKRLAECLEGSVHYQADVHSATDYAAFGALLDDRQWYSTTDSAFYRYGGSNGQEKDDEIYGTGNSYSAEFWQYDPRLARRWNVDPVDQISVSNYACFGNNPLYFVDPSGSTPEEPYRELPEVLIESKPLSKFDRFKRKLKAFGSQAGSGIKELVTHSTVFIAGTANAWSTNQMLGVGRGDPNIFGKYSDAAQAGQSFGDALSIITGTGEVMLGLGQEIAGISLDLTGVGAAIGVPLNVAGAATIIHGGSVIIVAGDNLIKDGIKRTHDNIHGKPTSSGSYQVKKSTPDTNPEDFTRLPGNQGYVHKKLGRFIKRAIQLMEIQIILENNGRCGLRELKNSVAIQRNLAKELR